MRGGDRCPFCGHYMLEMVDVGVGYAPVAVNCCEAGIDLYRGRKVANQILRFRQSHSPRKKARAMRLLHEHYPELA